MNRQLIILQLLVISFCLVACKRQQEEKTETLSIPERVFTAISVTPSLDAKEVTLSATLKPSAAAKLYARTPGYIKKIYVDIGSRVKQGQLLAEIDAPELNARLAELYHRMQASHADYLSSKDLYERNAAFAETPGYAVASELIRLKNKKNSDSLNYSAARYVYEHSKQTIEYLSVRAPFAGIITKRLVNTGDLVGASYAGYLFEMENNDLLKLEIAVPEMYTTAVLQKKEIQFSIISSPGLVYKASFARSSQSLEETTKSEIWEFETANIDHRLKSGMYAKANLKLMRSDATFFVPADAIVTTLDKKYIVGITNGSTRFIEVKTGFSTKDRIEIFGAINPGDTLVQPANDLIKENEKIKFTIKS